MAWAAITEPMIYEDAVAYADRFELACVSCVKYGDNITEFNVRPVEFRCVDKNVVYNHLEDGSIWMNRSDDTTKSYSVYYYVPAKVRRTELLKYIHQYLLPYKGEFPSLMLWQTRDGDRFAYSCMMGVFHSSVEAAFDNPLYYFESSTVPQSQWEKNLINKIKKRKEYWK